MVTVNAIRCDRYSRSCAPCVYAALHLFISSECCILHSTSEPALHMAQEVQLEVVAGVTKCLCKCHCRKKKQYVSMVKDDLSTVVRNATSVAGMGGRRKGRINAVEYAQQASFAKNQLLNALTEVSEMRSAIHMMERKMDSLLDKISRMSNHTLQSPTINYSNAPAEDAAADTVDDKKGFVHGSTRIEHSITKLTSDMALQTAEILALDRAALKKLV